MATPYGIVFDGPVQLGNSRLLFRWLARRQLGTDYVSAVHTLLEDLQAGRPRKFVLVFAFISDLYYVHVTGDLNILFTVKREFFSGRTLVIVDGIVWA